MTPTDFDSPHCATGEEPVVSAGTVRQMCADPEMQLSGPAVVGRLTVEAPGALSLSAASGAFVGAERDAGRRVAEVALEEID